MIEAEDELQPNRISAATQQYADACRNLRDAKDQFANAEKLLESARDELSDKLFQVDQIFSYMNAGACKLVVKLSDGSSWLITRYGISPNLIEIDSVGIIEPKER